MQKDIKNQNTGSESTFAERAVNFFLNLSAPEKLSPNLGTMNPYENEAVQNIVTEFYNKFYKDNNKRIILLGINPGRFGGGVTGISFTDPVALEEYCGIPNNFDKKTELSSTFIYSFIRSFGKTEDFYARFFISALYPLALIKDGKNYNYYDDKNTYEYLKPLIADSLKKQAAFGISTEFAVSLGRKNFKYLDEINKELKLFKKVYMLDHPRFIMQYRRKALQEYINEYLSVCNNYKS